MLKIVVLETNGSWNTEIVEGIEDAKNIIKIGKEENWETTLINDGEEPFEHMGIIMRDQEKRLSKNLLGTKGNLVFVGYKRVEADNGVMHIFDSLTDEQVKNINKRLVMHLVVNGNMKGSDEL